MSNYYSSNPKLYVGIDCIIFGFNEGELNLLLLKRNWVDSCRKTKAWMMQPNES